MRRDLGRTWFLVTFLAPAVLVYAALVVFPLLQAFRFSAYRWRGVSTNRQFVGTDNFERLFADSAFWTAIRNNLWLLVVAGAAIFVLALLASHAMRGAGRSAKVLRAVHLMPQVISLVAVAVMWQFIFNPAGLFNGGLRLVGLEGWAQTWLGDPKWALPAVAVAFVWYASGFYVALFSAGLQSIPTEVTEAAEIDGSVGLHRFAKVTWPLLWSVKRTAMVYLVVNTINTFALVFLMTRGGPDRKSEVMLTYLYEQAFVNSQFGYATSLAVVNFVVVMTLSLVLLRITRRNPVEARA